MMSISVFILLKYLISHGVSLSRSNTVLLGDMYSFDQRHAFAINLLHFKRTNVQNTETLNGDILQIK
jgi:hypothetical protein